MKTSACRDSNQRGRTAHQQSVFSLAIALLLCGGLAQAAIYRVKTDGHDANNGSSWALAKQTVGNALATAVAGDQVWVARGTYNECVTLHDGVSLYGGFFGNEANLGDRNWQANASILNGSGTNGPIVSMNNVGPSTRLDGMVITGGSAEEGGGVSLADSAAVVANNNLRYNSAGNGGGLSISGSLSASLQPTVTNNLFFGNYSSGDGGAIAISVSSPLVAWNQVFRNTAARNGGGIVCIGGFALTTVTAPMIANNFIEANSAGATTASLGTGGGIYAGTYDAYSICTPVIINNLIAANGGGGIELIECYAGIYGHSFVLNNTLVANSGPGLGWSEPYTNDCPRVCNNLVAFNSFGFEVTPGVGSYLTNNNVYGNSLIGFNTDYHLLPVATGQNGNISADPRLANYPFGDFHLQPDSPCRNAGVTDPMVLSWPDLDGQPRTGAVDIGAYESTGATWNVVVPVLYVSTNGNDLSDGLSWATAKRTLEGAIAMFTPGLNIGRWGLSGAEVWIAKGTYPESVRPLSAFVYLYGGFAGTETNRAQRPNNGQNRDSILDGSGSNTVVFCENGGYLVSRLDGFTVRNGTNTQGGGIRCRASSPVIANNLICSNSASTSGAGIDCYMASPDIVGNIIDQNESSGAGAGVYGTYSYPTIGQTVISKNRAAGGPGVYMYGHGIPWIVGNTVSSNTCLDSGWAGVERGGAISLVACDSFVVEQNLIQWNTAIYRGAGLHINSMGGLVQNNLFVTNTTLSMVPVGGGLDCTVSGLSTAPSTIVNNTFVGNRASGDGNAEYGGGLWFCNYAPSNYLYVANNVIVSNSSGIFRYGGEATLLNNCVFGNNLNYAYGYDYGGGVTAGAGDIHVAPQFVNAGAGDLHLLSTSPCVDAGTPSNAPPDDLDGVTRPLDGNNDGAAACDMGAYEFAHPVADTDHDGMSDQAEVIAGTIPTDAASVLKLRSRCLEDGNCIGLGWASVTGRTYCVQFKPTLKDIWQDLTNNVAGCGASMEVQDRPAVNRFYRLQVQQP